MELYHRTQRTDATVAQYLPAAFAWGSRDCIRMAAAHVRRMGNKVSLLKAGSYKSAKGAEKALARAGFTSVEEAIDAHRFARIAPALAWVGDLLAMPSEYPFPALAIRLSNGRALCAYNGGYAIIQPAIITTAWRIPCLITDTSASTDMVSPSLQSLQGDDMGDMPEDIPNDGVWGGVNG